jgi:hypothetical protein
VTAVAEIPAVRVDGVYVSVCIRADLYLCMYVWGRSSVVGYDEELASEWLQVRTLPCTVSLALRRFL